MKKIISVLLAVVTMLQLGISAFGIDITTEIQPDSVCSSSAKPGLLASKNTGRLYLDLESEGNLIFDKYSVDIYVDDVLEGTIANGQHFTKLVEVSKGDHTLYAYNAENNQVYSTKKIRVDGDNTVSCRITHGKTIGFADFSLVGNIAGHEIKMPDVKKMLLKDAAAKLKAAGFININYSTVWDEGEMIVISQNIPAGTVSDKNDYIQLEHKSVSDYYTDMFLGKNLVEVQEISYEQQLPIAYVDKDMNSLNGKMSTLDAFSKQYWTVDKAEQNESGILVPRLTMSDKYVPKAVKAPTSSSDFDGLDIKDAVEKYKKAGFLYVDTEEVLNYFDASQVTDGQALRGKIGSKNSYSKGQEFVEKDKVVITYAKFKNPVPNPPLPEDSSFEIYFLDVDEGDAAVIISDGHVMIVDGGDDSKSDYIYTFLRKNKIKHIDLLVNSNPKSEYVGGLAGALKYAKADNVISPVEEYDSNSFKHFLKYVNSQKLEVTVPKAGDSFELGNAKVTVLSPDRNSNRLPEEKSLILYVEYGSTNFLFMGDAEKNQEQELINKYGKKLQCMVLKAGRHGNGTTSTQKFIDAIQPRFAVISVGGSNTDGNPAKSVLDVFRLQNTDLYRTDIQGTIHCVSNGQWVTFEKENTDFINTYDYPEGYDNAVAKIKKAGRRGKKKGRRGKKTGRGRGRKKDTGRESSI